MAASRQTHEESKDKVKKSWKYMQDIEPDRDLLNMYCEQVLECGIYKSEYRECKSLKGRMNQYFVYGQTVNCQHLQEAYESCEHYLKTGDEKAKEYLISYELARRDFRMSSARANDVWEYRTTPYKEWNSPVQQVKQEEIKEEDTFIPARQNLNMNNANSSNQSNENNIKNNDKTGDQSNEKGSNSKQVSEPTTGTSNNKSMCVIS